jgi:hypothetical protein
LAADRVVVGNWNGSGGDTPSVRRGNIWYINNTLAVNLSPTTFSYGLATDVPVVGDWNGNGTTGIGVVRPGPGGVGLRWILRNSPSAGVADYDFIYGKVGDIPIVGNWNGTGGDTVGVYRGNIFHLRNSVTAGDADIVFSHGRAGDIPIVGDWDGDGTDSVGVVRVNIWYLRNEVNIPEIVTF